MKNEIQKIIKNHSATLLSYKNTKSDMGCYNVELRVKLKSGLEKKFSEGYFGEDGKPFVFNQLNQCLTP